MKTSFTGLTDPGLLRSVNQDNYYIDPQGRFFVVADGMGGHVGGQEASQIATREIRDFLEAHWESEESSEQLLVQALMKANEGILEDQNNHPERKDMGTTAVIILFRQNCSWCAHVGDSRLYRWRDSELEQITCDHTWVSQALKAGDITLEQARIHPWRHILSQCLGRPELQSAQSADVQSLETQSGDLFLLCSDGLTEEVPDDLISECLQVDRDCEETAKKLVEEAKNAGGSDNITVVLIAIGATEEN